MATSGSTDFSVDTQDIVDDAFMALGVLAVGQSLASEHYTVGKRTLNILVKQWMGPLNNVLPGEKPWQKESTTLTLTATESYTLKPGTLAYTSGGTYEISVGDTITGATSAATATVIAVSLASGTWAGGDAAGNLTITDQSGTFEAENLDVGANSNEATIAANSDQAGGGKDITIPVKILNCLRRDSNGYDTPMNPMSFEDYQAITDKDATGTPSRWYYERKLTQGNFKLDFKPSDTTDTVVINYLRQLEDFDDTDDTPDFPIEWARALKFALAQELIPVYPVSARRKQSIDELSMVAKFEAGIFEPEESQQYFQPGID